MTHRKMLLLYKPHT